MLFKIYEQIVRFVDLKEIYNKCHAYVIWYFNIPKSITTIIIRSC